MATNTLLLTTKIHLPRIRTTNLARPRLTAQLAQALNHQLTLISAPAGSGKTTLLSTWLLQCPTPFAWVNLDENDNDPTRFMSYCIAALRTLSPTLGETALALLQSSEPLELALIPLINELISLLQNDFLLILDDYHLISNPLIHNALTFLLEHQPPHLHLIIASRIDPPLPLARLRARHEVNELHLADLRFTSEETTSFCQQVMELHLAPEQIATLAQRTEGWITGLQLATLSLRGHQNSTEVATFIRSFSGRDRYVLDYLIEEVLQHLPSTTQEFLLNTSILNRLSPSLCAAVHNQQGPLLEDLERAHLFLIPLDNERCWYRYHHLFSELLHAQLLQRYPERETILYQRAAQWYEQNTMPIEAVSYALAAKDFAHVANLISDVAETMLKRGEAVTVASWLKQLPEHFLQTNPVLSLAYALTLLATSHFEQAECYLQAAAQNLQNTAEATNTEVSHLLGRVYAAQATVAINQDEYERAIELSDQALELLPEEDKIMRGILLLNMADAHKAQNDLVNAESFLHKAISVNQAVNNLLVLITAMGSLGKVQEQQGQLRKAEKTYRQALRLSGEQIEQGGQELPSAGKVHIFLSHLLYEWNRLEEAQEHAQRGIQLCQQWEHIPHLLDAYLSLTMIQQAQGTYEAAYSTLTMAEALVEKERFSALKPDQKLKNMAWQVTEASIHLWFAQGDLARIEQWVQEQSLPSVFLTPHNGHITLARLLLAQQQTTQARNLLEKLLESVQKTGMLKQELSLRLLLALALHAQGENRAATIQITRILEQTQSEEYIRTFVDLGSAMPPLLRLTSTSNTLIRPYINKLLLAFGASPTSETAPTLADPLTKREHEILRLVAAGMSNREIATTLVMTIGTVKWYVNSIYSKLQAHGRVQAIERARALHLLPLS